VTAIESWYWQPVEAIDYPFARRIHRDTSWLEEEIVAWCRRHHLIRHHAQEQQIRAALLAEFVSRANADVAPAMLRLIGFWTVWFFLADDVADTSPSADALATFHLRVLAVVAGCPASEHDNPLIHAAADLGAELRRHAGPVTLVRFQRALAQTLEAHSWEVSNQAADWQPDSATYNVMRLWSGAFLPMIALIDAARGFVLPPHLFEHALVQELIHEANRTVLWYNDFWSYPKEAAANCARHNIVHIVAQEQRVPINQALRLAIAQHDRSLQHFLRLKAQIAHFGNDAAQVRRFVEGIEAWLRATQDWSHRTARYRAMLAVNA